MGQLYVMAVGVGAALSPERPMPPLRAQSPPRRWILLRDKKMGRILVRIHPADILFAGDSAYLTGK
jgi:hypothetical protein